jgi:Fe-Mn family superoxide dismutase
MRYSLAPLFCRPWTLNGMTPRVIESHYEINYGGAVNRLNAITAELDALDPAGVRPEVIHRLKRDQFAALNSTLLHELYFASLGGDGRKVPDKMAEALARDFGSVDRWRHEFVALASALDGGTGWVVLTYVPRDERLINHAAADDGDVISGGIPVLALDMYEHAYHIDFGAKAPAYVDAFMRNVDWASALARYEDAIKVEPPRPLVQKEFAEVPAIGPEELKAMVEAGTPVQIIDARPKHYFTRSTEIMQGAVWRDPERIGEWSGELPRDAPVVVFCAYGFHVGCGAAAALRKEGFDARYLAGGHSAWKAIGGPVKLQG